MYCTDSSGSTLDLCDGADNDCNAATADGAGEAGYGAACDGADTDLCNEGVSACNGTSLYCTDSSGSTLDLCDGADNDCNAATADGSGEAGYGAACDGPDSDLCSDDTMTSCAGTILSCSTGSDSCATLEDCTGQLDFTPCTVVTDPERDYDICLDELCVSTGCGDVSCNAPGPSFTVPDTSQRFCANASVVISCPGTAGDASCGSTPFCGQDAQYGWDTAHLASERYTRSETTPTQPVVVDNVTGLMWQGCASGLSGSLCASGSASTLDWGQALAYCDALDWGGYLDWHLPDEFETTTVIDYGRRGPAIDLSIFPAVPPVSATWSSSTYASDVLNARLIALTTGNIGIALKTSLQPVRCARRHLASGISDQRFARDAVSEPAVTDLVTSFVWQGCVAGLSGAECTTGSATTHNWQAALAYCESLTWHGYADWRLPNIVELISLRNPYGDQPAIDAAAFPATPQDNHWSSSSEANIYTTAWYVLFDSGTVSRATKTSTEYVRCVR